MTATRFEVNGLRHYSTDRPGCSYPSVTTILGKTAGAGANEKLRLWNLANPGAREAAAERGSILHAGVESYVRNLPPRIPGALMPFWDGVEEHLDRYDRWLWSERPLVPGMEHCIGADDMARVWSHEYRFCGVPDLIGVRKGIVVLPDLKSSTGPYARYFPRADNGMDEDERRQAFVGYLKYRKCALQLAAYRIAVRETLGIRLNTAQILVTTPKVTQSFYIRGDELRRWEYKFLQKVRQFYDMVESGEICLQPREMAVA